MPPRGGAPWAGAPRGGNTGDGPVPPRGGAPRCGTLRRGSAGDGPVWSRCGPPPGGPPRCGPSWGGVTGDGPPCFGLPPGGGVPSRDGPPPGGAPRRGSAGDGPVARPRGGPGLSAGPPLPAAPEYEPGSAGCPYEPGSAGLARWGRAASWGWSRPGPAGDRGADWPRAGSPRRPPAEPMARAYPSERLTSCGQVFSWTHRLLPPAGRRVVPGTRRLRSSIHQGNRPLLMRNVHRSPDLRSANAKSAAAGPASPPTAPIVSRSTRLMNGLLITAALMFCSASFFPASMALPTSGPQAISATASPDCNTCALPHS